MGRYSDAETALNRLVNDDAASAIHGAVRNDLGVLAAIQDRAREGEAESSAALALDSSNRLVGDDLAFINAPSSGAESSSVGARQPSLNGRPRIALASFLFNWPSTGGGIVHTVELAKFLQDAGYDVHHFFVRRLDCGIGRVSPALPYESTAIELAEAEWNEGAIKEKFRAAVARYAPTRAIVTDSWNTKTILADALGEWPIILRFQALECLCPLNNIRLLPDPKGGLRQCSLHQLATPGECRECVGRFGNQAGSLHQIERRVSGYGSEDYDRTLRRALRRAHAVLVVNPLMEAMLSPYSSRIVVCPAGMDPERFPEPNEPAPTADGVKRILFAGLVDEFIKGYHVLREAAAVLWRRRRDFRIVATREPIPDRAPFEEFIGWQSQAELPHAMARCDIVAAPAVAQEAIGRTAVEGMAAGRPVVASRIGGLPFALGEGAAGLLCEPGDPDDLADKLGRLLDDAELRRSLGGAGRRRFEERFAWPGIIERQYRPLIEDEPQSGAHP